MNLNEKLDLLKALIGVLGFVLIVCLGCLAAGVLVYLLLTR